MPQLVVKFRDFKFIKNKMKNQKPIPAHAAESRQTAVRLRKNGWQTAIDSGKVPEKYREDIDLL